jgi:RHS repeat-associated protein
MKRIINKGRKCNFKRSLIRMLVFLLLLSGINAGAQNISRPNIVSPSGLQVNSYTGALFLKRADFFIPVPGLPLDISFAYSSAARSADQGFGFGWTFSYNQSYEIDTAGGIFICRGDGRKDHFTLVGTDYKSPVGIFDVLTQYQSGKLRLTDKNGTQYFFDDSSHKKLTRITDRNGNKTILAYTGSQISSISDSLGHTISFTWTNNRVTEIAASSSSDSRNIKYEYNSLGCLARVKKPHGVTLSYVYASNKAMSQYSDGNGNSTTIIYNGSNAVSKLLSCQFEQRIAYNPEQRRTYLTEVDDGKTYATTYEFDSKGRLINRSGNCCGYNVSFEYDGSDNVTKVVDGNQGTKISTYDNWGNLLTETDQLKQTSFYTYTSAFNQVATVKDKKGNQTIFSYDAQGNLVTATDPLSHSTTYSYDNFGRRITKTDKKGLITRYGYDQFGYLNLIVGAIGDTTAMVNDAWGNVLSTTNPRNATTNFAYDSLDRLNTVTDALQHVSRFTYDANGNRLSATNPRGKTTSYVYNWRDLPIKVTDALNHVSETEYDGKGNVISSTDANGHTTTYAYDNLSRLVSTTNAAGEITACEYDNVGNKTVLMSPNGNTARLKYDAINRVTEVSDVQGIISKYSYDANSNKLTEQDGKGNTITYQYDVLNRVSSMTDALGNASSYVYDNNDNLTRETDRKGNATNYTYDNLNRRISQTDALSNTTTSTYDKAGNPTSLTDANTNVTSYTYDALNRLVQEKFADNTTKAYTYDSSGNLKTRTDNAGHTTTFIYDDANRPVLRSYTAALVDTFAYDKVGVLIAAKSNQASVTFIYDAVNRIKSETLNGKTTSYAYNIALGKRTIIYPGGRQIENQFNSRDQLSAIRESGQDIATYEYDIAGRNTKRSYQNGTVTNLAYDADSRVTDLNHNPSRFVDFGYAYDKEGNPTATQFRHNTAHNEQYTYDNGYQLTGFTKGATVQGSFNYDAIGNRTTAQLNGTSATYSVSSMNAYSSISYGTTVNPTYDINGNLTSYGSTSYSYDRENRLIAVNGGTTAIYTYDALGRRIRKITGADTTNYFFDGQRVIEERSGSDSLKASYVWGRWIDDIVSMRRSGQNYFYHTNNLGSVVSVTNSSGAVVERYEYDAFGKVTVYDAGFMVLSGGSAIANPYLFTGRDLDKETGLYYYRARYYDPIHGRFVQRDPMGYIDGMGTYAYVGGNPVSRIDPSGLIFFLAVPFVLGGASITLADIGIGVALGGLAIGIDRMLSNSNQPPPGATLSNSNQPPPGSVPISDSPWSGDHGEIKDALGIGGRGSVYIDPDDNVWVQHPDGSWSNEGEAGNYTGSGKPSGRRGKDRDKKSCDP